MEEGVLLMGADGVLLVAEVEGVLLLMAEGVLLRAMEGVLLFELVREEVLLCLPIMVLVFVGAEEVVEVIGEPVAGTAAPVTAEELEEVAEGALEEVSCSCSRVRSERTSAGLGTPWENGAGRKGRNWRKKEESQGE